MLQKAVFEQFHSSGLCKQCTTFSQHRHTVGPSMLQCVEDSDNEYQQESALVLKRVNDTRWCARADASKAVSEGYSSFQKASQVIDEDMKQKLQVIHEAKCLLNDLSKKEILITAGFWAVILSRINGVNKYLQTKSIELQTSVNLLKSLLDFLNSQREMIDEYERKANEKIDSQYIDECRRARIRKRHCDAENVVL